MLNLLFLGRIQYNFAGLLNDTSYHTCVLVMFSEMITSLSYEISYKTMFSKVKCKLQTVKGLQIRSHEIKFSPVCFQRLCNFKNFPEPGEKKKFRFVPIFSVLGKSSARVHREENLSWNEPEVFEL